jgi:hypothetical protein
MREHIKNLVERLSLYSDKLDKIALVADKKWVLIDEDGNQQTYIFERNGDLVMSKNGAVKMGKWKFYPEAKSIKIDRIEDQILLNQAFFDKAVMVLKYDGINNNDFLILVNENIIPDLNIEKYLLQKRNKLLHVINVTLKNNITIEIINGKNTAHQKGLEVTIKGLKIDDGTYYSKENSVFYIKDGKIQDQKYLIEYRLKNGNLIKIEQEDEYKYSIGDKVLTQNLQQASSGKYKISFMQNVIVEDGIIVYKSIL